MKAHALSRPAWPWLHGHRMPATWLRFVTDRFLWLPLGAAIALVWANTAAESYFRFAHTLAFPVNEIGMAVFLGLITQEAIEAVMPGGALHTWRRWAMPIVAAVGGLLGSTFVYLGYISWRYEEVLAPAWPIACAIDMAAGYYVLKTIFRRSRTAADFLLILGIASNAVGILILAVWPAFTPDHLGAGLLLTSAVGLAALLRRAHVRTFWPYFALCGTRVVVRVQLGRRASGTRAGADRPVPAAPAAPSEPIHRSSGRRCRAARGAGMERYRAGGAVPVRSGQCRRDSARRGYRLLGRP